MSGNSTIMLNNEISDIIKKSLYEKISKWPFMMGKKTSLKMVT